MARPRKKLEWFQHFNDMQNDPYIRALRKKFGNDGYAILNYLLEYLCKADDFVLKFNDKMRLLLAVEWDVTPDRLANIVDFCVELDLFAYVDDNRDRLSSPYLLKCLKLYREKLETDRQRKSKKREFSTENAEYSTENAEYSTENNINNFPRKTPSIPRKSTHNIIEKNREEDIDSSLRSESQSSATTGKDEGMNLLAFQEFFNRTMQEHGAQIPTITQIGGQRRQRLLARVKEYGKEAIRKAIINAATAPFLNGAGDKPFVASLDWIVRPNNFPKVLEGNYNHAVTNPNLNSHGTVNNNGYRSREDIIEGAMRNAAQLIAEGAEPKEKLPIV